MDKQTAVFGGGCFWCTEATFQMLRGVISVMPGYSGGLAKSPTYEEVCGGNTGHAEVIKIEFDADKISYSDLLSVLFAVHDPTTINRQGNDVGTQYRSIILYSNENQKKTAKEFIKKLSSDGARVVTELKPLDPIRDQDGSNGAGKFYEAEEYHHDYFKKNPDKAYCQVVINPKLEKVKTRFSEILN